MNAVMMYANVPAADLRTRGVPEQVIHFVESHRAHLQRTIQQQQLFRGSMIPKPNMPGQPSEPGRINPDVLGTFPGILYSQQGSIPPAGARPSPPGHPADMSVNGTSNGQPQPPQKPLPVNGMGAMQAPRPSRPTAEQSQEAIQFIQRLKTEFITNSEHLGLNVSLAYLTLV